MWSTFILRGTEVLNNSFFFRFESRLIRLTQITNFIMAFYDHNSTLALIAIVDRFL